MSDESPAMALFHKVRGELFSAIERHLASDGVHKTYEGRIYIARDFPDYFSQGGEPMYRVHLDLYVIGPNRHYDWTAHTLLGAVSAFAADVRGWIAEFDAEEAAA